MKAAKTIHISVVQWAVAVIICMALASCAYDAEPITDTDAGDTVDNIEITIKRRANTDNTSDADIYDEDYFDIDGLTPYSINFNNKRVIHISQNTPDITPFQREEDIFSYRFDSKLAEGSGWDIDDTYNFTPYNQKTPLQWTRIGANSLDGGFQLFSLHFPLEEKVSLSKDEYGGLRFKVMEDQSTLDNLQRSDILGAYHSMDKLYQRLRFRLHHMMTYVRIRLYVPVFDQQKNTGYREGALLSATLNNVTPEFAIEWNAGRDPDTQGPKVSALSGEGEIKMYLHPLEDGMTEHPVIELNGEYLRDGYFDQGLNGEPDKVRVYDFSVIIPEQRGTVGEDGQESNFTSTNFLNFAFRTNSGAVTTYYFNQAFSNNKDDSQLDMTQGKYQYLQLYVPRVGNKIIYLGATVKPWNHNGATMVLQPDEDL